MTRRFRRLSLFLLLVFVRLSADAQAPADSLLPYSFGTLYTSTSPINQSFPLDTLPSVAGNGVSYPLMPVMTADSLSNYSVGLIPMQETITPTGARMITIPFEGVAVRGVDPGISLVYSSQSDMGIAGFGWHLSGLSAISFSGKNRHYDNSVSPVDLHLTSGQSLYLDGVRLVANPDSGQSSWANYETATGYVKVRRRPIATSKVYDVYYPDGTRAVFGHLGEHDPIPSVPIVSKTDIRGNNIFYEYTKSGNQYVVTNIYYGGSSAATSLAEIRFIYEPLASPLVRYIDGISVSQNQLLKRVETWHNGNLIREYTLSHECLSDWPMLTKLRCRNASGEEVPPLQFAYEGDTQPFSVSSSYHGALSSIAPGLDSPEIIYKRGRIMPPGCNDGLIIYPNKSTYGLLSNGKYGNVYPASQEIVIVPRFTAPRTDPITVISEGGFQAIEACDVDGDGIDEIVKVNIIEVESDQIRVKLSAYHLTSGGSMGGTDTHILTMNGVDSGHLKKREWLFGDFVGNGKTQLLSLKFRVGCGRLQTITLIDIGTGSVIGTPQDVNMDWDYSTCYFGALDYDGDGKVDLLLDDGEQLTVYSYDDPLTSFAVSHANVSIDGETFRRAAFGDINGDGLIDYLLPPEKSYSHPGEISVPIYSPPVCPVCSRIFPIREEGGVECYNCHSVIVNPTPQSGHCQICNSPLDPTLGCPTHGRLMIENVPDVIDYDGGYQWELWINTGAGFNLYTTGNLGRLFNRDRGMLYDVDGDGLSEVITLQEGTLSIHRNRMGSLFSSERDTLSVNDSTSLVLLNATSPYAASGLFYLKDHGMYNVVPGQNYRIARLLTDSRDSYGIHRHTIYRNLEEMASQSYNYMYTPSFPYYQALFQLPVVTESVQVMDSVSVEHHRYRYRMPVANREGLGFRGFTHVEDFDVIRAQTSSMDIDPVSGLLISTTSPVSTSTLTWMKVTSRGATENYVNSTSVVSNTLTGVSVTSQRSYDEYGNPTSDAISYYPGALTEYTETTYKKSLTGTQYYTNKPEYRSVTRTRDGESTCSEEWISYTQGLPVSRREAYSYGGASGGDISMTNWSYDAYGNLLTEAVKPYNVTTPLTKTYTYDSVGEYLQTSTDEMGFTTTYGQYNRYGDPQSVTDHRGRTTIRSFDSWGRLVGETSPDGKVRTDSLSWSGTGLYQQRVRVSGAPATRTDYDALGREIRSGVQRYDGRWQWTDTQYNANGLVSSVSLPYIQGNVYRCIYTYDTYNRPLSITLSTTVRKSWSYDGLTTTETREGVTTARTVDAKGNLVSATDSGGTISYALRADDQPKSISVTGGGQTTFQYDSLGRRKAIVDPSAGTRRDSVVYASSGNKTVYHQTPNGSVTRYFDRYGRLTHVDRAGAFHTYYTYNNDGLLTSEYSTNTASRTYTYDSYDRVTQIIDSADGTQSLQTDYAYNGDGTLSSVSYSSSGSGPITSENYTYANGWRTRTALPDGTIIWELTGENELGQVTSATTGTVVRTYGYSNEGYPTFRRMNGGSLQDAGYVFDPLTGNLLTRSDGVHNLTESFTYDSLNRIVSWGNHTISYADNGNIQNKHGLGSMSYGDTGHPYRVSSITLGPGASTSQATQQVSYTSFERPSVISQDGIEATFTYNGSDERTKMTLGRNNRLTLTRYYIGGVYERDQTLALIQEKLYLGGDYYSAPMVYVKTGNAGWTLYNLGRDYQGSVTHVATADGVLVAEYSYDPWGRLRDPQTLSVYAHGQDPSLFLGRGYTGHEHLKEFDLINMNARLYDPNLGRFLSPDPYVQAPDFTQSFNRYSYALNNPLKYSDESGEFWGTWLTLSLRLPITLFVSLAGVAYHVINDSPSEAKDFFHDQWSDYGKRVKNAWEMDMGFFGWDSNKSIGSNLFTISLNFSPWSFINNALGNTVSQIRNNFSTVNVEHYNGATLVNRKDNTSNEWGMTLGSYIISKNLEADPTSNDIFAHEYGHVIQSRWLGPVYIPIVGVPSIVGEGISFIDDDHNHRSEWYEVWANNLAYRYYLGNGITLNEEWLNDFPRDQQADWYSYATLVYYLTLSI